MPFIKLNRAEYDVVQQAVWVDTDQIIELEVVGGRSPRTIVTFSTTTSNSWPYTIEVLESPAVILGLMEPEGSQKVDLPEPRPSATIEVLRDYYRLT